MATNFPAGLDVLPNPVDPGPGQYVHVDGSIRDGTGPNANVITPANPALAHETQHANANDAVRALQAKVGVNGSAVTTSIDYLLKNPSSINPGHKHGISSGGTGATNEDDAILNIISGASDISPTDMSLAYIGAYDADGGQAGRISVDYAFGVWFGQFGASNNRLLYYFNGAPFGLANAAAGNVLKSNGVSNLPSFGKVNLATDTTGTLPTEIAAYTLAGGI